MTTGFSSPSIGRTTLGLNPDSAPTTPDRPSLNPGFPDVIAPPRAVKFPSGAGPTRLSDDDNLRARLTN